MTKCSISKTLTNWTNPLLLCSSCFRICLRHWNTSLSFIDPTITDGLDNSTSQRSRISHHGYSHFDWLTLGSSRRWSDTYDPWGGSQNRTSARTLFGHFARRPLSPQNIRSVASSLEFRCFYFRECCNNLVFFVLTFLSIDVQRRKHCLAPSCSADHRMLSSRSLPSWASNTALLSSKDHGVSRFITVIQHRKIHPIGRQGAWKN